MTKRCEFPDCKIERQYRKYCPGHQRQLDAGKTLTPLYLTKRPNGSEPRIRYDESPCPNPSLNGPCHVFHGSPNSDGYAHTSHNGKTIKIHRHVWEKANGTIPPKMEIDHQCRNRMCCNIDHLRVVTGRVNRIENSVGISAICAAKTHCKYGHEFNEENTRIYHNKKTGKTGRVCLACKKNNRPKEKEARLESLHRLRAGQ